jgi:sugar phosphate isomerase/epimerase
MQHLTRRNFLTTATSALAATALTRRAHANPLGLPLGLQLYSVREQLATDYLGTLKQLSALGYREVEAAGFFGHSPTEVKQAMTAANLSLVSAHFSAADLARSFEETLAVCSALGLQYLICSFPQIKDPSRLKNLSYENQVNSFTLDDYRWNADRFNTWGAKVKSAGIQFGYHNHTMEFAPQAGIVPLDELLRLTNPSLVTLELDCGWVTVGGADPVTYLKRYPTRISMLHVKDFKPATGPVTASSPPPAAELGRGTSDYHRIFAAASRANIRHAFVEQEAFDMPPFEALRIDAEYMQHLHV